MENKRIYTITTYYKNGADEIYDTSCTSFSSMKTAYQALGNLFVELLNNTEKNQYLTCQYDSSSFTISDGVNSVVSQIVINDLQEG